MAANFQLGQNVKLIATIPTGPVEAITISPSGVISYLIQWTDAEGVIQQTWFPEADLAAA
jgi:hypothetical protein